MKRISITRSNELQQKPPTFAMMQAFQFGANAWMTLFAEKVVLAKSDLSSSTDIGILSLILTKIRTAQRVTFGYFIHQSDFRKGYIGVEIKGYDSDQKLIGGVMVSFAKDNTKNSSVASVDLIP